MIGNGLTKLAAEHGMKIYNGIAYGSMNGYSATLSEGGEYKGIVLTTKISDPVKLAALRQQFEGRDLMAEYFVKRMEISKTSVVILFYDNPYVMKKIYGFLEELFPALEASGATKQDVCLICGTKMDQGSWKLINGIAFCLHDQCAQMNLRDAQEKAERLANQGSYLTGTVGALLGAALGAVVLALVGEIEFASIVCPLVTFLAARGYVLFRGKRGCGMIAIMLMSVVFGAVMGTYGMVIKDIILEVKELSLSYSDITSMLQLRLEDSEFVSAIGMEVVMGMLAAAFYVPALLCSMAGKRAEDYKMIDLE